VNQLSSDIYVPGFKTCINVTDKVSKRVTKDATPQAGYKQLLALSDTQLEQIQVAC
jgi:hypothetical protein